MRIMSGGRGDDIGDIAQGAFGNGIVVVVGLEGFGRGEKWLKVFVSGLFGLAGVVAAKRGSHGWVWAT